MSENKPTQQGGTPTPKPQPQQGQSGATTQQLGGQAVIRDWASI